MLLCEFGFPHSAALGEPPDADEGVTVSIEGSVEDVAARVLAAILPG